jgi:hypothetical protein
MARKAGGSQIFDVEGGVDGKERLRGESLRKIRSLKAKSLRGAWAFSAFLLVSIGALNDFGFLRPLPENIKTILGSAPPVNMISGLLVLYSFSAIILILSRMMRGTEPSSGMIHVLYLSAFYGFYHLAASLDDNFWAVFAAGMTILGLVGYHNRIWCMALIREEEELLHKLDDGNKPTFGGNRRS